jgi:hypothetical protein
VGVGDKLTPGVSVALIAPVGEIVGVSVLPATGVGLGVVDSSGVVAGGVVVGPGLVVGAGVLVAGWVGKETTAK